MGADEGKAEVGGNVREPLVRAPRGMIVGPIALALVFLAAVEMGGLDEPLFYFFNAFPEFTGPRFWAMVTILGDGLVCAVLLLPWIRRNPERVWGGLLGALLMVIILRSFKAFLSLPRPLGVLPEEIITIIGPGHRRSAFPSGHAATMAVLAGVLALTTKRRLVSWLALGVAVLVGISRIAVGVHWPSDVLAGLALGWASAWIGLRWAARAPWVTSPVGNRVLAGALVLSALVLLVIDHTGYPGVLPFQRAVAVTCLVWGFLELRR